MTETAPEPTFATVAPWPEGKPLPDEWPADKLERWEAMPIRYRTAWRCPHQRPSGAHWTPPLHGPVSPHAT